MPVIILAAVWLWVLHWTRRPSFAGLLGQSVTVRHLLLACGIVSVWNVWLVFSVYTHSSARRDLLAEIYRLTSASCASSLLLLLGNLSWGRVEQGLELAILTAISLFAGSLVLLLGVLGAAFVSPGRLWSRDAVLVGTGRRSLLLRSRLEGAYPPFRLHGCIDNEYQGTNPERDGYLGTIDELERLLRTLPVEIVFIALPMRSKYNDIERVTHICEAMGVETHCMQDLFETSPFRARPHSREAALAAAWGRASSDPRQILKRLFDIFGALLLLALFSPLMLVVAVLVRLTSAGPALFVQQRFGRHRKCFSMFKFRSMVHNAEQQQAALEGRNEAQGPVFKLRSDPRITPVGSFLRRTSIDELPQLLNVLRGDMSLVGPRPLPVRDVSRFEEAWLLRRFSVRPGLTCLWQINGRSDTSFDQWIRQDLLYIDQWSFSLDLKILFLTIPAVFRGDGAV